MNEWNKQIPSSFYDISEIILKRFYTEKLSF